MPRRRKSLGFRVLNEASVPVGGDCYHSAMLDFGPSSVDGWLARLVAAELGVQEDGVLDCAARELVGRWPPRGLDQA